MNVAVGAVLHHGSPQEELRFSSTGSDERNNLAVLLRVSRHKVPANDIIFFPFLNFKFFQLNILNNLEIKRNKIELFLHTFPDGTEVHNSTSKAT